MGYLIAFFLRLPWWAYFGLAGGIVYFAEGEYQSALEVEAEYVAALESPAPTKVNLSDFARADHISPIDEVTVTGWFNYEYNYELTQSTNGIETDKNFMWVLFGEGDTEQTKVARAAIVLKEAERDLFLENLYDFSDFDDSLTTELQFTFNGFGRTGNSESSQIADVFRDEGLTRSPNFIFLTPFLKGREVSLARQGVPQKTRHNGWLFAAVIALFGLAKLVLGRAKRAQGMTGKSDAFANGPIAGTPSSLASTGVGPRRVSQVASRSTERPIMTPIASSIHDDSPLGRLNQREFQETVQPNESPSVETQQTGPTTLLSVLLSKANGLSNTHWVTIAAVAFVTTQLGFSAMLILAMPLGLMGIFWFGLKTGFGRFTDQFKTEAADPFERLNQS